MNLFKMNMGEAIQKYLWITWHACGLLPRITTQICCANVPRVNEVKVETQL